MGPKKLEWAPVHVAVELTKSFSIFLFCFSREGTTSECGYHSGTELCRSRTISPGGWHE